MEALEKKKENLNIFLKIPPKCRLKDEESLIDKAFNRKKKYDDPYNQIEDKVGVRFVVLLQNDIRKICDIIEHQDSEWSCEGCRHFEKEREENPLLFTYQSVHYVIRPKNETDINGVKISVSTPCEVQIRTLLQHAHAELTHDAIYKTKKVVKPKIHRTVAKSMALIETTDDFFENVTAMLNHGPLEEHKILEQLDGLYFTFTNIQSHNQKSTIAVWDTFERFIDENLVNKIQEMVKEFPNIPKMIKEHYAENAFYHQSTVFFVYWLLENKRNRLLSDWPLPMKILEPMAIDLGISLSNR
jgi:ppGpp synthetase/RelA/SpoT-type nucleotidyltranferase